MLHPTGRSRGWRRPARRRGVGVRAHEGDGRVEVPPRQVGAQEGQHRVAEVAPGGGDRLDRVDDLHVRGGADLPQAMASAPVEERGGHRRRPIAGKDEVADVEHAVVDRVRLVELRFDEGRERRHPQPEPDAFGVVVEQLLEHGDEPHPVVGAPVGGGARVDPSASSLLRLVDERGEVGAVGGVLRALVAHP